MIRAALSAWEALLTAAPESPDAELARRILAGDREAFEAFVARFQTSIFRIAYRMTGNGAEAEDLTQEVFLRLYQNLASYDTARPLAPWVSRVACHHVLNRLRKARLRTDAIEGNEADAAPNPEEALVLRRESERVRAALRELPPRLRLAITLKYEEGMTAEEIGAVMQAGRNTVKTWLFRARESLRRTLDAL